MPKGKQKKLVLKTTKKPIILFLVKFLLIKIGNLPLYLIYSIYHVLKLTIRLALLPIYPIKHTPYFLPRHRGRPRKKPLLPFYFKKFKKLINKAIPKPIRIATVSGIMLLIFLSYTFITFQLAQELPHPSRLVALGKPLTTEFYDRNGKLLYRLYEGTNRALVKIDDLPPHLVQATLSIEDRNFYSHIGIDPVAILRAFHKNISQGSLEGASTITQQLVKNSLLTTEKTYSRKIKEIFLAIWAERIYSKKEILQMYLSEAPYGGPIWGVESAALGYFGKSARDLNLAESSFLAGLPASPTKFSPYGENPELAKVRQREVLRRMVEDKFITQSEADEAFGKPLDILASQNNIKAPHFVMYVKQELAKKYGARVVSQGGLRVTTTVDLGLQLEAERIVKEEVTSLQGLNVKNGAAMVTDGKTGQILAMVGSYDYHAPRFGNFNITTSPRQPGSSVKVLTYLTAFKKGYSPGNTILDTPVAFRDAWGNSYSPVNYDGTFHGAVSIRTALGSSYNIPAVKILANVGVPEMIQTARDLGITTWGDTKNYGLSLTLGAADTKMIDLMSVYGTLSQLGVKNTPTPILKVTDSNGNVLEEYSPEESQVLSPEIAYLITNILTDNRARTPAFGPNSLLFIKDHEVAVKTGTSDNKRDNWTFGYTPDFVVGVWVGNNDNSPMNPGLTSGATGAAPIWNKIMNGLLAKHPSNGFTRPQGVVEALIDGRRDLMVSGNIPKGLVRIQKGKEETKYFDAYTSYATSSATVSLNDGATN